MMGILYIVNTIANQIVNIIILDVNQIKKKMTKIAIVGPIPRDTIKTHKGEVIQKYGCVSHPTIALAKLFEDESDDMVVPIAHVHKKDESDIKSLFKPHSKVNVEGIYSQKDAGTIIELDFIDQKTISDHLAVMHR